MNRRPRSRAPEVPSAGDGLRRREVLKAGGVIGAAAFLEGCRGRERQQIEQVLDRSRMPPGTARWTRSICEQCMGRCELSVRVLDGRAKKIEGDASSQVSMGGVCALGHSALQGHYLPERPTRPMRRTTDGLEPASWEEAMETLAPRLIARDGTLAFCCGPDPLERAAVESIAARMKASVTVVESPTAAIERAAAESWLGRPADIETTIEGADLLITLGASPLDRWRNPVAFARRLAEARARCLRWVHVGERMSLSAAKADLWIAPRPGSAQDLLGLLGVLDAGAADSSAPTDAETLAPILERTAISADVPRSRLDRVVRWWHEADAAVLVVGAEDLAVSSGSPENVVEQVPDMVDRLDLARRIDAGPKGLSRMRATTSLDQARAAVAGPEPNDDLDLALVLLVERSLEELAAACAQGVVQTVISLGVDPLGATPHAWGLWDLEPARLVSVAHRLDETARAAEWVLPAQTDLERTQVAISPGTKQILIADGVVDPRDEARHPLDVLRALALAGGVEPADLPWEDAEDLRNRVVEAVADLGGGTVARAVRGALRADGRLPLQDPGSWQLALREPSGSAALHPDGSSAAPADALGVPRETPSGPPADHSTDTLALQIFEAPRGEAAAFDRPWIAELPDPVSTVMWGGWIELAPVDAERLGLSQGAAVEVVAAEDPSRIVPSTAYIHPACRPGTAAMPLGVFRRGDETASALDLVSAPAGAGGPSLRATVHVRSAERTPAPIFGRGLRSAEQIPAGWKAQEHASLERSRGESSRRQVIALGGSGRRASRPDRGDERT